MNLNRIARNVFVFILCLSSTSPSPWHRQQPCSVSVPIHLCRPGCKGSNSNQEDERRKRVRRAEKLAWFCFDSVLISARVASMALDLTYPVVVNRADFAPAPRRRTSMSCSKFVTNSRCSEVESVAVRARADPPDAVEMLERLLC
jgi:hypothetical protein